MKRPYQICTRCLMDTSAVDIAFDENGRCNYCTGFLAQSGHILHENPESKKIKLDAFIARVKTAGRGKRYDCVVGVSGGVDSSWVLVQVVKLGLRPLAVHMDNGWNSELAQNNIANLVRGLGIDLYTHVIDWDEYRNLMQAFFKSDVIDVEMLYDNAMLAVNYQQANKYGVRFILSGSNSATEGMSCPPNWNWFKLDKKNIYSIGHLFGHVRIKTFPAIGIYEYLYYIFVKRIKWILFLDLFEYNKFQALDVLERDFGFKRYQYKHNESIFTRFYQGYILPKKFDVDKRKLHLGTLVVSGQMSREDALKGLEGIPYSTNQLLEEDIQYFLKKMGWTREDLEVYLKRPEVPHNVYPTDLQLWNFVFIDRKGRFYYKFAKKIYKAMASFFSKA